MSASSPRNARRSTGRHRKPEPSNNAAHWLRMGAATAGIGAAVAFGPGVAFADDGPGGGDSNSSADGGSSQAGSGTGSSGTATPGSGTPKVKTGAANGATRKGTVDPEAKKDEPADEEGSGSKRTTKHTTKSSTLSRHTASPAASGTPAAKVKTVDDPPSSPAAQTNSTPAAVTAVTPAATSGPNLPTAKAGLTALANAPQVTAAPPKVTLKTIVRDLLTWTGLKALVPFIPLPPVQFGGFLESAWLGVRQANARLNNQGPEASSSDPIKQADGTYKGKVTGTDYENDTLKYTGKIDVNKYGTLVVDQSTGAYVYAPTAALKANGGTAVFTVTVSDGPTSLAHFHGWNSLWGIYSSPVVQVKVVIPRPA